MDRIEVSTCSQEVQQQLRDQFIRLRQKGWKLRAISEAIGVCVCSTQMVSKMVSKT